MCVCVSVSVFSLCVHVRMHICSIWTRALHMYGTLLWYARDVHSQLVIVVFVVVLCDLQCLVLVAIVTIIYSGRTLNTILAKYICLWYMYLFVYVCVSIRSILFFIVMK